jgi:hypothetical protein
MASTNSFNLNNRVTQLAKRISELPIPSNIPTLDGDNTFTGQCDFFLTPTTETQPPLDNSIRIATTAYVDTAISNIVNPDLLVLDNTFIGTNDFTNQVSFSVPPHSEPPVLGNDLTTKGYVDSLVGQYSGGLNLFLNYSEPVVVGGNNYFKLSNVVSSALQQSLLVPTVNGENLLISFITDELNILELPTGLWNLLLYGAISATANTVFYHFHLKKYSAGIITTISLSGNSLDVNATPSNNPDIYHMNATVSSTVPLLLTDRIIIEVYYTKNTGSSVNLTTYFENAYYSFIQSTLNAGTTLLTSNNNWTANNNFVLSPTVPTVISSDNSYKVASTEFVNTAVSNIVYPFVGTATSDLNMNGFNIGSSSALTIGQIERNTNLVGRVYIPNDLIVGEPAEEVRIYGGRGGDAFDTTTQNDIQIWLGVRERNSLYVAFILPTTTGSSIMTLPSALNSYSVKVVNNSQYPWTIRGQIGEPIIQGQGGFGTLNPYSIFINAFQTITFLQVSNISGKVNILDSQMITGTVATFPSLRCPYYDSEGPLSSVNVGTLSSSATNLGRLTQSTDIRGNVKINGSSGLLDQVLTSTGETTAPIWAIIPENPKIVSLVAPDNSTTLNVVNKAIIQDSTSNPTKQKIILDASDIDQTTISTIYNTLTDNITTISLIAIENIAKISSQCTTNFYPIIYDHNEKEYMRVYNGLGVAYLELGTYNITNLKIGSILTAINANNALSFSLPSNTTAHTKTPNNNSTQVATTAYVATAITNIPENPKIVSLVAPDNSTTLNVVNKVIIEDSTSNPTQNKIILDAFNDPTISTIYNNLIGETNTLNLTSGGSGIFITSECTLGTRPLQYYHNAKEYMKVYDVSNNTYLEVGANNGGVKFLTFGGSSTVINANDALSFSLPSNTTAHTQTPNNNSTQVATTEYVDIAISDIVYPFVGTATSNLNMDNNSINNAPSIDSSSALTLGGTTASGVNIGRTSTQTKIDGTIRMTNIGVNNYIFRRGNVTQTIITNSDRVVLFPLPVVDNSTIGISYLNGIFTNNNAYPIMCCVSYTVGFNSNSVGFRNARIVASGSIALAYSQIPAVAGSPTLLNGTSNIQIPSLGTFNVSIYQNSTSSINLDIGAVSIQILVL